MKEPDSGSNARNCTSCGAELSGSAEGSVCPKCLLGMAMADSTSIDVAESGQSISARSTGAAGSRSGAGGWEPPAVEELQVLLPQYEIESIIGRGGMGAVYRGRQAALDRPVAIKLLPETLAEQDDGCNFVERFKLEARAMAGLDHPAIISVHDFGQTAAGHLYFVMEFIDGMDMHRYIQLSGGTVEAETAVAIVSHVLDALDYAHSKGIVHRDIKPANVLINREGRVKIADFGLAKRLTGEDGAATTGLTMSNVALGTPDFIAPEALDPTAVPDHRADLYAVGVMLYQMLTGKVPRGIFKLPSELDGEIDPRLDEILTLAMEADPGGRFQSATEFRLKLDELASAPVEKVVPEVPTQEVQAPAQQFDFTEPGLRKSESVRRHAPRRPVPARKQSVAGPVVWTTIVSLVVGGGLFWWIVGAGKKEQTGLGLVPNPVESSLIDVPERGEAVPEPPSLAESQEADDGRGVTDSDWPTGPHFSQEGGFKAWSSVPNDQFLDLSRLQGVTEAKQVYIHGNGWIVLRKNGETISHDGKADKGGIDSIQPLFGSTFVLLDAEGRLHQFSGQHEEAPVEIPNDPGGVKAGSTFPESSVVILENGSLVAWGDRFETASQNYWGAMPALAEGEKATSLDQYPGAALAVHLEGGGVRTWSNGNGEVALPSEVQRAVSGGALVLGHGIRGFPQGGGPIRRFEWESGTVVERGGAGPEAVFISRTTNSAFCIDVEGSVWVANSGFAPFEDRIPGLEEGENPLERIRDAKPGLVWVHHTNHSDPAKRYSSLLWFDAGSLDRDRMTSVDEVETDESGRIDGLVANGEWQDVLSKIGENPSYSTGVWTFENGTLKGVGERVPGEATVQLNAIHGIETEPLVEYEARLCFTVDTDIQAVGLFLPSATAGFAIYYFNSKDGLRVGVQKHFDPDRHPQPDRGVLFPDRKIVVGETHVLVARVSGNEIEIEVDGERVFSNDSMDWSIWDQSLGYSAEKSPIIALRVANGAATFHSLEFRVPGEPSPSAISETSRGNSPDVPELLALLTSHQDTRRAQLSDLIGKYRPALVRAEEAAIAAGELDRVEAVQAAIERADDFAALVAELSSNETIEPLPELPPLGDEAPDDLKRLRGIFDSEVAKIEASSKAEFEKGLESLQAELVRNDRLDEARMVEAYRTGKSSAGETVVSGSSTGPGASPVEWTSLFNGRDLTGWTPSNAPEWSVRGTEIRHRGEVATFIATTLPYREFEIEGEFLVSSDGNGGIVAMEIAEMQIVGSEGYRSNGAWSGGIMGMKENKDSLSGPSENPIADGQWHSFRWTITEGLSESWIDGTKVASLPVKLPDLKQVELRLQAMAQGEAGYRDLRARPISRQANATVAAAEDAGLAGLVNLAQHRPGEDFPRAVASHTWRTDTTLEAIDGIIDVDTEKPFNHWSSYGSNNLFDWLEIDLGTEKTIEAIDAYLFVDNGGVKVPQSLRLERWSGSEWIEISAQKRSPAALAPEERNRIIFPPIRSSRVRLVFENPKGARSGVTEVMVWGAEP